MAEKNKEENERELLLEVYKLYMGRYNAIFPMVYQDVKFYVGFAIASSVGLFGLLQNAFADHSATDGRLTWIFLLFAGGILSVVSVLGYAAFERSYGAWLRCVSTLIKLESDLGLLETRTWSIRGKSWDEPIVFPTHASDAAKYKSSKLFVDRQFRLGYGNVARLMFGILTGLGGIAAISSTARLVFLR